MKLENQVCTLEQARELKELGVNAPSLFYWWHHFSVDKMVWTLAMDDEDDKVNERCPAYNVAELGEMLPDGNGARTQISSFRKIPGAKTKGYACQFEWNIESPFPFENVEQVDGCTEAQARAAMLIYLIKNGHVKVEDINKEKL